MSQIDWRRPLGLAATLFVLGTFAYWLEFKHRPKEEELEDKSKRLFQVRDTQVQSIKLVTPTQTFQMECLDMGQKLCKPGDNSKWQLTEPLKIKADSDNANSLLSSLNNTQSTDTIDLKDEKPEKRAALLKEYGLDAETRKSVKKISVKTASGETVLYMGASHPVTENQFGLIESNGKLDESKVVLVPNTLKPNMEKELTYWREKKLFTLTAHEIESFTFDGTKAHFKAQRKDGKWLMDVKGEAITGDIENVDNLLTAITYLTAKDFASNLKTDKTAKDILAGAKSVLSFTLQKEKGTAKETPEPVKVVMYEKTERTMTSPTQTAKGKSVDQTRLYATLSNLDPLFELEASAKTRVDKEIKDLRMSKLITSMERFSAKRLEFVSKALKEPVVLSQADGKWTHQVDKTEVKNDIIQGMLDKLSGNRIKDYLTGPAIPPGEQDGLKVTLGEGQSDVKRQLLFWKANGKLYGRDLLEKGKKEAFLVDPAVQEGLPWDRNFFKGK